MTNRELLLNSLTYRLTDLTAWVGEGVIVLFLVLFLLAEGDLLVARLVRSVAAESGDEASAERTLTNVTRKIRAYLRRPDGPEPRARHGHGRRPAGARDRLRRAARGLRRGHELHPLRRQRGRRGAWRSW